MNTTWKLLDWTDSVRRSRKLVVIATLIVMDWFIALGCIELSSWLISGKPLDPTHLVLPLIWILVFAQDNFYPGYAHSRVRVLRTYLEGSALAAIIVLALYPALSSTVPLSYGVILFGAALVVPAGHLGRVLARRLLLQVGAWGRPVAILGAGDTGIRIAKTLFANPLEGLVPVAFFDDDSKKQGLNLIGIPVLGAIENAHDFAKNSGIDHAIVAIPHFSQDALARLTSVEAPVFKSIRFIPNMPGLPIEGVTTSSLGDHLVLEVRNNLRLQRFRIAKRVFDLVGAALGLILLLPLMLLIAALVCIDSKGPPVFSQERIGKDGKSFRIWKFRTMVRNADHMLEGYLTANEAGRRQWHSTRKLNQDPRVTRVGRFLRRTSIDELPQLVNVIRGEMSLVGPRPIVHAEIDKYGSGFELYSLVRPGMTGYWQVSGRSDTSYERRVELDEFYTRNWSIYLDLVVLVATARVVLSRTGAY